MEALEQTIAAADQLFARVHMEEQSRSELIALNDVVEEQVYADLRTGLRDIEELAAKIKERGQLVPILVWLRRGQYVLLSGHRRVAALRSLGETYVKAIVYGDRDLSAKDALNIAIDDNIDRNNFSKTELAHLVAQLVNEGMTQRQIAKRLRLSNGSVSDYFRMATAPEDVRAAVDLGRIAMRAGLLLAAEPEAVRTEVLTRYKEGMLSLGDVKRLITRRVSSKSAKAVAAAEAPLRLRARRGGAWNREISVVDGLAWERTRQDERELRVQIPANPTAEQKLALRKFFLEQVRAL